MRDLLISRGNRTCHCANKTHHTIQITFYTTAKGCAPENVQMPAEIVQNLPHLLGSDGTIFLCVCFNVCRSSFRTRLFPFQGTAVLKSVNWCRGSKCNFVAARAPAEAVVVALVQDLAEVLVQESVVVMDDAVE
jgi:hypothetical protein